MLKGRPVFRSLKHFLAPATGHRPPATGPVIVLPDCPLG